MSKVLESDIAQRDQSRGAVCDNFMDRAMRNSKRDFFWKNELKSLYRSKLTSRLAGGGNVRCSIRLDKPAAWTKQE
jgi:hypothetical protein